MSEHVLDRPVWHSLAGPLAHLARRHGSAIGFDPALSPFVSAEAGSAEGWADIRTLLGPGGRGVVPIAPLPVPDDLHIDLRMVGYQMIADGWTGEPDPEAIELAPEDADEMLDLASRTRPGPYLLRTREIGRFIGFRIDGKLVAMAGERFHPPGYTEVSAVCTDPEFRGRGLGERAVRTIMAGIVARGETPILHVVGTNPAVRLYERMGFTVRLEAEFVAFSVPT